MLLNNVNHGIALIQNESTMLKMQTGSAIGFMTPNHTRKKVSPLPLKPNPGPATDLQVPVGHKLCHM